MRISEVHIDLVNDGTPLLAFVRMVLTGPSPCFGGDFTMAMSGLKVIAGHHGVFVAMPDRKLTRRCTSCNGTVNVVARFCQWCAVKQPPLPFGFESGRAYADIAFPADQPSRDYLHRVVMEAYLKAKGESVDGDTAAG